MYPTITAYISEKGLGESPFDFSRKTVMLDLTSPFVRKYIKTSFVESYKSYVKSKSIFDVYQLDELNANDTREIGIRNC